MKKISPKLLVITLLSISHVVVAQNLSQLEFGPKEELTGNRIDGVAAIVGNDIITIKELNQLGNDKKKLDKLIMKKLLIQAAKKRNIVVGDTALNIAMDEARNQGKSLSRKKLHEQLMINKLRQSVAASLVNISEQEINNAVEQRISQSGARLKLIDVLIRLPKSAASEDLQRAQEKAQKTLFRLKNESPKSVAQGANDVMFSDLGWVELSKLPATFSKVLVDAPTDVFLTPIVDRDGIHLLKILARESEQVAVDTLTSPTETRVSHILIKDKDNPIAETTINKLYQQLQNGSDFAQIAQQYSQDLGSANNGGSLEWAYPGQMVPDFEAIMDKTSVDQISAPFKSPFGYHILKVHERRQVQKSNQEAIKQQVRSDIFQKRATEEWSLWLSRLRDEAYVEILK